MKSNTSSFKAEALMLDEFEGLSSSLGGMDGGNLKKAIVFGESGCGKSRGLSMLKEKMAEDHNIFSYILPCKPLIGKFFSMRPPKKESKLCYAPTRRRFLSELYCSLV